MAQFKMYNITIHTKCYSSTIVEEVKKAIQRKLDCQRIQGDNPWIHKSPQVEGMLSIFLPWGNGYEYYRIPLVKCGKHSYSMGHIASYIRGKITPEGVTFGATIL